MVVDAAPVVDDFDEVGVDIPELPKNIVNSKHFYRHLETEVQSYLSGFAPHVGLAPSRDHFAETMRYVHMHMLDLGDFLKARHSRDGNSSECQIQDGVLPPLRGNWARSTRWSENKSQYSSRSASANLNSRRQIHAGLPSEVADGLPTKAAGRPMLGTDRQRNLQAAQRIIDNASLKDAMHLSTSSLRKVCQLLQIPWLDDKSVLVGHVNTAVNGVVTPFSSD